MQALRSSGVSVGSQAAAFFHRNGKPGFRMGWEEEESCLPIPPLDDGAFSPYHPTTLALCQVSVFKKNKNYFLDFSKI